MAENPNLARATLVPLVGAKLRAARARLSDLEWRAAGGAIMIGNQLAAARMEVARLEAMRARGIEFDPDF